MRVCCDKNIAVIMVSVKVTYNAKPKRSETLVA
jgi:hypothetical protein